MKIETKQIQAELIRVGIYLSHDCRKYLSFLQPLLGKYGSTHKFILNPESPCSVYLTTDMAYLKRVLPDAKGTINDFKGSRLELDGGVSCTVLPPLEGLVKSDVVKFQMQRFLDKAMNPASFYAAGQFTFEILDPNNWEKRNTALYCLQQCELQAWDIETPGKDLAISCCSISGYNIKTKETHTYVLELDSFWAVTFLRDVAITKARKIFQNGQYDLTYLLRYNIIPYNYCLDTMGLFHAWYAELPKTLAFIASWCLRDSVFWKEDKTGRFAFLRYNARDTFYTLHACIALLLEMPDWAYKNYSISFPLQFPCLAMGLRGLAVDKDKLDNLRLTAEKDIEDSLNGLKVMSGEPNFNPSSPKQTLQLFHILGAKDLDSTDAKNTDKFALKHPLNARIASQLKKYREATKFYSNYATVRLINNRLHYTLNPWGTESGRFSSSGSHFNENVAKPGLKPEYKSYGFQIQNVPPEAKVFIVADPGFVIIELDGSQAESRTTAYLSQDETMIYAVEESPDFHSFNASKFFGILFEHLWDIVNNKTLNKPIRDLSKRVNHGANYNMGVHVLIATMGEENMYQARRLLNLPENWTLEQIAMHLLMAFCRTYSRLKGTKYMQAKKHTEGVRFLIEENTYYGELLEEIKNTGKLTSVLGWTRRCLSDPRKSKPVLNEYVAHPSQNLSVSLVNRGLLRVYSHPDFRDESKAKLCAQIHDSLLFQIREDLVDTLVLKAEQLMNETIIVHGRELRIPFVGEKPKRTWK